MILRVMVLEIDYRNRLEIDLETDLEID